MLCNLAFFKNIAIVKELIQLMPDHLANQIAAGEVIQRPASVVKELLENSLDAGATEIKLYVKDAGKELIQVVDNGTGMSPIDARMSFERHATSKIRKIEDLFQIRTMGFRGEALASIAAVAQVELKTKKGKDELGTGLLLEASEVKSQEPIACATGTSFAVRNLFYNIPARRKFLKSNTTEYKHILDEFIHVALAFPEVSFRLFNNQVEQFNLPPTNLKKRILDLLGERWVKHLIPVKEEDDLLHISGYVGKPEAAGRTRGNQFFFVNDRFIKSAYLNHAVKTAFEGLIEKDAYPFYILKFDLDSTRVDVNVHPSKQEVKFDDEQILYAYLKSAIKKALGQFNVTPSLDFTLDTNIQNLDAIRLPTNEDDQAHTQGGFLAQSFSERGQSHFVNTKSDRQLWEQQKQSLFPQSPGKTIINLPSKVNTKEEEQQEFESTQTEGGNARSMALKGKSYLITTVRSGFLLIHRFRARERIVFEALQERMQKEQPMSQKLLFPIRLELGPTRMVLLKEAQSFLKLVGFGFDLGSDQAVALTGLPVGLAESEAGEVFSDLVTQIEMNPLALQDPMKTALLKKMAAKMAYSSVNETIDDSLLIDELFACKSPKYSPRGKKVFRILQEEELEKILNN